MSFWPLSDKSEAILCKLTFRHGHRAGVFIWKNFHPGYRDLGNRASSASHMNTSIFLQRKEWRGEASPVDRAHMKRSPVSAAGERESLRTRHCQRCSMGLMLTAIPWALVCFDCSLAAASTTLHVSFDFPYKKLFKAKHWRDSCLGQKVNL